MIHSEHRCPYCDGSMLRHIRHGELYWFCISCREEDFASLKPNYLDSAFSSDLRKHLLTT